MRLEEHPMDSRLLDYERDLSDRLIEAGPGREALPYRFDSKIVRAVIVAAECSVNPGAILVVAPSDFTDPWVERWNQDGRRRAIRSQARNKGTDVVVSTVEEIKRNERSFRQIIYSVIVIAGGIDEEDADWLTTTLEHRQAWWMVAIAESCSWPLGVAEQSLYYFPLPQLTFRPTPPSRPSSLAKRATVSA